MNKQELDDHLMEQLADAEHASWARWMDYLFDKCTVTQEGNMIIPADFAHRWQNQIYTSYANLTEQEKESDRKEVRHILPFIHTYVAQLLTAKEE